MHSSLVAALCLAAGLTIIAGPAPAQNYDPDRVPSDVDAQARQACTPDVMRLCNDYIPNIPDIVACLKRERQNLSPACAVVFAVSEPEAAPPAQRTTTKASPKKKSEKTADTKKKTPAKAGPPLNLTSDAAKATK
jgi:hypothetical protein